MGDLKANRLPDRPRGRSSRAMTELSNDRAIRHHEVGHEAVRDDDELIDFKAKSRCHQGR